ncbi:MAG: alkaline phosphatase D family protein [Chitinophagales bacterium]
MKTKLLLLILSVLNLSSWAQPENESIRSLADADLKPFYHGVASGDPLSDAVIIWTRVTPETDGDVEVTWRISKDTLFTDTLQQGVFTTNADRDYTVKVDVQGLDPNTYYYYEFSALNKNSIMGRTKTAPDQINSIDQLRFAVVSCSNYPSGYFTVYEEVFERNDVDAVLHLGDYIYEYGENSLLSGPRQNLPDYEIIELADYRLRHATYKLDEDSRKMHQNYPIISTWDDHESANNSWRDGADNHSPNSEGEWSVRKAVSHQAYYEWMPIRIPDENNLDRIWRKLNYGNLADIFVLDTRLYDRDEQGQPYDDPNKKLIGPEQMEWLQQGMANSTAKWKIIAQQVVMAPLVIPDYGNEEILLTINSDQWDGYLADRTKLYDFIVDNSIDNVVVLTGDIHTSWANDLPYSIFDYNKYTGAGSIAVEFVSTSVTSTSSPIPLPPVSGLIRQVLPYIKYVELSRKGYTLLDLTEEKAQGDFYTVNSIQNPNSNSVYRQSWYTADGENHLVRADTATVQAAPLAPIAPCDPREMPTEDTTTVGLQETTLGDILNIYPNPFYNDLVIEAHLFESNKVDVSIVDTKGSYVLTRDLGNLQKGRNLIEINDLNLPVGIYKLLLTVGNDVIKRSVVKIE